jgi:type IV pilus assembly protein PilY1
MNNESRPVCLVRALGVVLALLGGSAVAETTDLSSIPMVNATTVSILPNVMFILDDSGSMDSNYMPDYVANSYCRKSDGLQNCKFGDPPFNASAFNRSYYNPMVTYSPPKNADGTSKTSYDTAALWEKVPNDGYGKQDNGTTNLLTGVVERKWCNSWNDWTCSNGTNTRSAVDGSNSYEYPDATYFRLQSVSGAPYYYNVSVEWCSSKATSGDAADKSYGKAGTCQAKKTSTYKYVRFYNWSRVDITAGNAPFPGPDGKTRTYAEEMTNYANWWAWYSTRMQMVKTAVGHTFSEIRGTPDDSDLTDKDFFHARVGFTTISDKGATNGNKFLSIGNFDTAQKSSFYTKLYNQTPNSWTPLRGALMKAGLIYAGKQGTDPVQYSCQRNFTILSTDGYWNTNEETTTYGPFNMDGTEVGDQDGAATKPEYDKLAKANTLADVAYYYYHTDLRPDMTNNVPPAGNTANEDDVASHQHMTTFTVGLGVDGTLAFLDSYKNSTSGDYYDIKQGTKYWPDPIKNSGDERIDDLWHAAVNGRGTYFSAKDPESLVDGLTAALGSIEGTSGSGAAAATSNLQPTEGDNFIYVANYRTVNWDGELSGYPIDLSNGTIGTTPKWQANTLLQSKIAAAGDSDTRTIYTSSGTTRRDFLWSGLTATEKTYFDNTKLTQYSDWSSADITAATGERLLNYLRGQDRFEDQDRSGSYGSYNRLFRDREKVIGDIVHSQPVFVQDPLYNYTDTGYSAFKLANASRAASVYVGANDGMLHAFNADDGTERWAYVPPLIMENLWLLADSEYATNHRYFIDGPTAVSDIYTGTEWKTILVGAFGKGGRGYYALDITDPASPQPLWSFTANDNADVGYTYGVPMITKVDGTWSVLLASGYNNVPEGAKYSGASGVGKLFVLNAASGAVIKTISTGVGSVSNPSGLARLNIMVENFEIDNSATTAYGGDLLGNLWRFDLVAGTASAIVALGDDKPIMITPEIGQIDGKTVLLFGTGRYLGQSDLTDTAAQGLYAIRDDGSTTVAMSQLVEQTFSGSGTSTTTTTKSVDWATKYGWFANLPISGERVTLDPQLYFGTVIFATTIPSASECEPGGYGRVYEMSYLDGATLAVLQFTSPPVGVTVAKLPGGSPKIYVVPANGKMLEGAPPTLMLGSGAGSGSGSGNRIMWRELLN